MKIKNREVFKTNIFYLIIGVLLIFGGSYVQTKNQMLGLLITQFFIILIPNLIYGKIKLPSIKMGLRLNKISSKQCIYTIFIMIFAYPVAVFLNMLLVFILMKFGNPLTELIGMPTDLKSYFISVFVVAIMPGICEEIMFRGNILNGYKSLGEKKAIVYTGILFGLFHFNLQNLLGPIFLGIVLGTLNMKTNSIYSSILGHIFNNALAITIGYFGQKNLMIGNIAGSVYMTNKEIFSTLGIFGIIALISFIIVNILISKMPRTPRYYEGTYGYHEVGFFDFTPVFILIIFYLIVNIKVFFL